MTLVLTSVLGTSQTFRYSNNRVISLKQVLKQNCTLNCLRWQFFYHEKRNREEGFGKPVWCHTCMNIYKQGQCIPCLWLQLVSRNLIYSTNILVTPFIWISNLMIIFFKSCLVVSSSLSEENASLGKLLEIKSWKTWVVSIANLFKLF